MMPSSLARRRARGAAFVEAIIVVSSMILMLLGMVFFRTFYIAQMQASRVARATVMAYSMGGCDDSGGPSAWAGPDLNKAAKPTRSVGQETRPADPLNPPSQPSKGATKMLNNIPGAPVSGNALFPVAEMGLELSVRAMTKDGALAPERGFKSKVRSTSHVVCGEQMKEGNIMDLVHFAKSFISTSSQPPLPDKYVEDPPPKLPPEYQ